MKFVTKPNGHDKFLLFEVEIDPAVSEKDVFGALYNHTDVIESCSLNNLQKSSKAKCVIERRADGKQVLIVPFSCGDVEAALLAAMIESINMVAGRPAKFTLIGKVNKRTKLYEIDRRAKELETTFLKESFEPVLTAEG
ncbi:MAG: hypothetical protein QXF45_03155 [Candidatus Caldarchaeum sp.]